MHEQRSVKSVKRASVHTNVGGCERGYRTEREDMVASQDDHALIATLGDILKV